MNEQIVSYDENENKNGIEEISISTSFITELSCIGIKYSETIFGANSKATAIQLIKKNE